MKMKAAVLHAPMDLRVEMIDIPDVGPDDMLLKVIACGICGSDVHSYKVGAYVQPGQVMGHEFVARVEKIGDNVKGKGIEIGDRVMAGSVDFCMQCYWCQRQMFVFCPNLYKSTLGFGKQGAFAEFVKIPNALPGIMVNKLPDGLTDYECAIIEPTGVAAYTVDKSEPKPGDKVVILGAGLIGMAALQFYKNTTEVEKVVVSEISQMRLEACKKLGADAVIDAKTENVLERCKEEVGIGPYHFNEGAMADIVVEAAGVPSTIWDSFEIVRSAGTIAVVGLPEQPALIDTTKFVHKQPTLIPVHGGNGAKAIEGLLAKQIDADAMISHVFKLEDAVEAFNTQADSSKSLKVLITP